MYLCMCLFVLLDLFIPVLQNCRRTQLICNFSQPNVSTNLYFVDSHQKWSNNFQCDTLISGGSEAMAQKHYQNRDENAYQK